jgi:transposase
MAQKKPRGYPPEFREAAAREVVEKSRPVADVVLDCGVTSQSVWNWVKAYRATHAATDPELTVSERERLRALERRVRELEKENQFVGRSVAFFAKKHR